MNLNDLLLNCKNDEVASILEEFNKKNKNTMTFPEFSIEDKKILYEFLFEQLKENDGKEKDISSAAIDSSNYYIIQTLRIMSRDKLGLEYMVTSDRMDILLSYAKIHLSNSVSPIPSRDFHIVVEAEKCLCNLIFNSSKAQRICSSNRCVEGIIDRLKTFKDPMLQHDIKYFYMKLLHLITALCVDIREKFGWELHGFSYLTEVLDSTLKSSNSFIDDAFPSSSSSFPPPSPPPSSSFSARDDDEGGYSSGRRPIVVEEVNYSGKLASCIMTGARVDLACEILKILFNIAAVGGDVFGYEVRTATNEDEAHFMRLVSILHDLLLSRSESRGKSLELQSHVVNLLTAMPRESFEELLCPLSEMGEKEKNHLEEKRINKNNNNNNNNNDDGEKIIDNVAPTLISYKAIKGEWLESGIGTKGGWTLGGGVESNGRLINGEDGSGMVEENFEGYDMRAVNVLIRFLRERLDNCEEQRSLKENLCPILHCLTQISRYNRIIRKFCRLKILPYMKDEVKALPEEGSHLRNKLCKLLTSPVVEVKNMAASFVYVLCKESCSRVIKYTGYGNAAGLFMQRGLMMEGCGFGKGGVGFGGGGVGLGGGGVGLGSGHAAKNKHRISLLKGTGGESSYSSDSEDSETEEYSNLKDKVNPITGRWEGAKKDPFEGMTEEQKEFEALQLINKIDKLQRCGLMKPMKVDDSGHPLVVESIAQMVQETHSKINNNNNRSRDSGDDNDDN